MNKNYKGNKRRESHSKNYKGKKPYVKDENKKPQGYVNKASCKIKSFKFKLPNNPIILSSFVIKNESFKETCEHLNEVFLSATKSIVFIPAQNKNEMQKQIVENYKDFDITCIPYNQNETEGQLHNKAFSSENSDIFIATNSNMKPRRHSFNILKSYLYKESAIITVPLVYNQKLEIQPYSMRLPTLWLTLQSLFGFKKAKQKLVMMERGLGGYYKIHRIHNTLSQTLCINSKAFQALGLFPTNESEVDYIKFYEKTKKLGNVLFVPMARFIEINPKKLTRSALKKLFYLVTHVF